MALVFLSVRWCAPEVILHRQVMRKSDVWSFGIVLIEMFSKGAVPYQGQEQRFHFPNSYVVYEHVTRGVDEPDPSGAALQYLLLSKERQFHESRGREFINFAEIGVELSIKEHYHYIVCKLLFLTMV